MKKNKSILIELVGKPLDWAENGLHKVITTVQNLEQQSISKRKEKAYTNKRLNELKQVAKVQELQMESLFTIMREEYQKSENKVNDRLSEINQGNLDKKNEPKQNKS